MLNVAAYKWYKSSHSYF